MWATLVRVLNSTLCAVGCLVAATGCYTYRVLPPTAGVPGATVRATLNGEGMTRLEEMFGEPRRTVEGEVYEADGRQLLLLSRVRATSLPGGGFTSPPLSQRVIIERSEIVELEERVLDRTRTAMFAVAVTGALTLVFVQLFNLGGSGGLQDPPSNEDRYRATP